MELAAVFQAAGDVPDGGDEVLVPGVLLAIRRARSTLTPASSIAPNWRVKEASSAGVTSGFATSVTDIGMILRIERSARERDAADRTDERIGMRTNGQVTASAA